MSRPDASGAARPVPTSNPILKKVLVYDCALAVAIALVGAIAGGLLAGGSGVASALIGTAMTLVFLGITAASILVANRFAGTDAFVGAFFGIVLGAWLVKFVVFIVLLVTLSGQPWIEPTVLFVCIVVSVVGSLAVDVVVLMRNRMSYASDVALPKASEPDRGEPRSEVRDGDETSG